MSPPPVCAAQAQLAREHGALLRQMAALQQGVGQQLQAQARHIAHLEADRLRLRAELLVQRTAVFWDLGAVRPILRRPAVPATASAGIEPASAEAQAVNCQTGCVGHAHAWLDADGQCRRSGQACERVTLTDPAQTA